VSSRLAALAATVALAAVAAVAPAGAEGTVVTLRVESETAPAPLFDGPVTTTPHAVDGGDGSGPHPCWGPPGASPAATATGALDDALRGSGIVWRGNWDPSFGDFFVDRIGEFASAAPADYWSLSVDGAFSAGGCHAAVADGDTILFRYGALFAPEAPRSPGTGRGGGKGSAGGGAVATVPPTPARRTRSVARAAAAFLRRAAEPGESWAKLALALRAGRRPSGTARRLAERLRALPATGEPIGRDVDSTALAAWALAARGRAGKARGLAAYVRSTQVADGGFPIVPGGASNAQSTGVALIALRVTGLGPRPTAGPGGPTPLDYLASLARRGGSVAYRPGERPTPVWTTAQALLGLTTAGKLIGIRSAKR
jgi:hypothetical protein